jgi:glycosyltransferase involved in cell wall biosynthesis
MRIAQIVSTYHPYKSGMGNIAEHFTRELRKKSYEIRVLTPSYEKDGGEGPREGVRYLRPLFSYGNSAFVPKLYSQLKDIDLIHLHYPFFGGAETVALFKQLHPETPLIISYHMDVAGGGWLKAFFRIYGKILFPWIIKKADKIIVSSMDYARASNLLSEQYFHKVVEIPFGVDERFCPDPKRKENAFIDLLFVSALDQAHYFKGLDILIEALGIAGKQDKRLRLHIVGDGPLLPAYKAQAQKAGVSELITFHGRLSDEALIRMYQQSDATLKPSIDRSEAFGLTLIESMACGTPVIATNLPGVRTVFDQHTGIRVPVNDVEALSQAILEFASDEKRREEMRTACLKRVQERYRWPSIINQLDKIYRDLV